MCCDQTLKFGRKLRTSLFCKSPYIIFSPEGEPSHTMINLTLRFNSFVSSPTVSTLSSREIVIRTICCLFTISSKNVFVKVGDCIYLLQKLTFFHFCSLVRIRTLVKLLQFLPTSLYIKYIS